MTDFETLEKYEKALEAIARNINPSVMIQNGQYYLVIPQADLTSSFRVLSKDEGDILFELFGGTNYDTK